MAQAENKERDGLQLGIFMPNCSATYHISSYKPEPDDWTFESNKQIALAAEKAGFNFLFPVSRWRGFGGSTNYMGYSQETMTWAAALLAVTQTIRVYSTVHVPVFRPLVAAKWGRPWTISARDAGGSILSVAGTRTTLT